PNVDALAYHHTDNGSAYKFLIEACTHFPYLGTREGHGCLCLRTVFFAYFGINEGIAVLGLLVACSGNAEIALAPVHFLSGKGTALEELLSPFQFDLGMLHDGFSLLDHRPCRTPFLTVCPLADASEFCVCLAEAQLSGNDLRLIVTRLYNRQHLSGLDM